MSSPAPLGLSSLAAVTVFTGMTGAGAGIAPLTSRAGGLAGGRRPAAGLSAPLVTYVLAEGRSRSFFAARAINNLRDHVNVLKSVLIRDDSVPVVPVVTARAGVDFDHHRPRAAGAVKHVRGPRQAGGQLVSRRAHSDKSPSCSQPEAADPGLRPMRHMGLLAQMGRLVRGSR